MKKIIILGSTGSIGVNALNVIRNFPEKFRIIGVGANENIDLLKQQAEEFNIPYVIVKDGKKAGELKKISGTKFEILSGEKGLIEAAEKLDYDILIGAMVGFAGLAPTLEAIKRGKRIALANKETLVVAGELVKELARRSGAEIMPVDSEHSAIFQCLTGENINEVEKLILTASGGPFLHKDKSFFNIATVNEALNHPNWKMGNKITIDSATMMNKGLEVIEAHWLFGLPAEGIEVVVHPQSIIHSMVQFRDGSLKAQLGIPDMKLPIQYALSYPERLHNNYKRTNMAEIGQLNFLEPDFDKFECLKLAYDALNSGGTAPCILNAANESAVEMFLQGKIKFSQIPEIIKKALDKIENHLQPDFESICSCDNLTREYINTFV
ncbi:MAG: 1-deoxy-D-xylulose-5-phosphate reductoisomerase [Ignavibacteriaceae bacterium]